MDFSHMESIAHGALNAARHWLDDAATESSTPRLKEDGSEVTDADESVQRLVVRYLRDRTPTIPVIGEESAEQHGPIQDCWLLDPIDGTMNFARHAPYYAISLALVISAQPVVGVVDAPALHRRFSMDRQTASQPRGRIADLEQAIVGITGTGSARSEEDAELVKVLHRQAYRIRMHGSMCLDLVGVAMGWLDACICVSPKPWDVAAGVAIARSRGCTVLGERGSRDMWSSSVLVAGSEGVAKAILELSNR